jgi:PAS domain S-box-containing protein
MSYASKGKGKKHRGLDDRNRTEEPLWGSEPECQELIENAAITDSQRAPQGIHESKDKYRSLLSNIPDVVWQMDEKYQFTFVSTNVERITGYAPGEVYQKGAQIFFQSLYPDDVGKVRDGILALFTNGQPFDVECRAQRKNGEWIWVHSRASATYEKDGIRYADGLLSDVTARKRTEEALVEAEEALHPTQFALEHASDAVFWIDSQARIVYVNDAACRSLGYSREELLALSIPDIDPLYPRDASEKAWEITRQQGSYTHETQHRTKQGKVFPVEVTSNHVQFGAKEYHFAFARDITERKRAEAGLRHEKYLLHTVMDNLPDFIYFKDRESHFTRVNLALAAAFDLNDPTQAVGKSDADFFPNENAGVFFQDEQEIIRTGRPLVDKEEKAVWPDGQTRWISTTKMPLRDPAGEIIGTFGVSRDISERKRVEEQLQTEAKIAEIFLSAPDDEMYQSILDLALASVKSPLGLFGFIDEERDLLVPAMKGSAMGTSRPVGATPRFRREDWGDSSWARALRKKTPIYSNELSLRTPPGHVNISRHISFPILFRGEAIGLFVAANKETDYQEDDVLALAKMAAHVAPILSARLDRQRAEATRDYLASIVEFSGEAIIGKSLDGIVRSWNAGAEKLYGYAAWEVVGQPISLLVPPERRDEIAQFLTRIKRGEEVEPYDTVRVRKDGRPIDVSVTISPLKNALGEIVGASTVARDITAHRELERMKDELVSVVSHELRTPLTSIRGALGLLAGGLLLSQPEKGQRMLEIAVSNTDRLVRLINDILDLERMESGKMNMEKQTCNAVELMREAVENVRGLAEKAGVTLSVTPCPARLWADPDRIVQAFINLLSNAIKFSPRGGTVWLTATPQMDQITFRVRDQGRGIPADKRESIFERFQQVDASDRREKGGTGLGLPITRSIVQQHGGRIWVESTLGQGSSFFFSLPTLPAETVLAGSESAVRKILACGFEADTFHAIETLIVRQGYALTSCSWQEIVEKARTEEPDVILLEYSSPDAQRGETVRVLKETTHTKDVPVIGVGGVAPDEEQLLAMGLAAWATKPLHEASLLSSLKSVFGRPGGLRVLVIEDDNDLARVLTTVFERHGAVVFHARTGQEAVRVCPQFFPDLLVLDVLLPELDGFGVVEQIRRYEHLKHVPLAVYSVKELDDGEKARLRLGESIFMTKSRLTPQEFEQRAIALLNWATSGQRERRQR